MENKSLIFREQLLGIEKEIHLAITDLVQKLGGKVCVRHYQDFNPDHYRNVFFDIDDNGHGFELLVESVKYNPMFGVTVYLRDTEDCYYMEWDLATDFNASNSYYLLDELEEIAKYVEETGSDVVTEYNAFYEMED